jgi:hypothetical protein
MTALMLRANRRRRVRGNAGAGPCLAFFCHYA